MEQSTEARDPFAFARQEEDDNRLLALFRHWLDASRTADRHVNDDDDQPEWDAAIDRLDELEDQIFAAPGGPVSLALKTYFKARIDFFAWTPEHAMLRGHDPLDEESDAYSYGDALTVSLLRDAARVVPELAELAAPVIHEDAALIDAEIQVGWCRRQLASQPPEPATGDESLDEFIRANHVRHIQGVRVRLARMLDRLATTEAKTARGRAIKAALGYAG